MLQNGDLKAFLNAFAKSSDSPGNSPQEVLAKADGLFPPEIWRLGCSLQIAAVLGNAPQEAAIALRLIHRELKDSRSAALQDQDRWTQAIGWARMRMDSMPPADLPAARERDVVVGNACLRLRERGYKIEVEAYGPQIEENSRRAILGNAEAFVGLLGGRETANQILRFMRDANFYHDGMWLFGEVGLNIYDAKRPMVPVGWLLSLALRYLNRSGHARKPERAWKSLVDLAIDFAAAHDCQRYSQYEDFNLHASQFHQALANSTLWREFFTLPQVPSKALRQIFDALAGILTPEDERELGFSFCGLAKEIYQLVDWSADDRLTIYPKAQIENALPLLGRVIGGAELANAGYSDPVNARGRTQDSMLLFACASDRAVTLPRAFLAAAACERVFRMIWSKLGRKRASNVVGKTLEDAIAAGCKGKVPKILCGEEYWVARQRYEFDVATRDVDQIVLIETKGKSLTQNSRSGDMFSFFQDYSDSFLLLLGQLVRHEINLREGKTPLSGVNEDVASLRPLKVAVSPLSFGPVSDKVFSSAVLRSLIGAKLTLLAPDEEKQKLIQVFNERVAKVIADMTLVAPKKDGLTELVPYLIDVFWLDLGQLLYILNRANTVWDAFGPLKHITFSSRDFWTELAYADRQGLTKGRWRPIT